MLKSICEVMFPASAVITMLATVGLILQFNPTKFDRNSLAAKLCVRTIAVGMVFATLCAVYILESP